MTAVKVRVAKTRKAEPPVTFTHPEKVLFPGAHFTKADVIRYYLEIARWLLPHLRNRPVTLKRFPNGIHGEAFYEKDRPEFTPEWVQTFPVPRAHGGEDIRYILVNDARTLAWCANLATIELHPFLHRAPAIDQPTQVVFDLDPGEGADLLGCIEVASLMKAVLDRLKLKCFPKVSGSKGLQLYVPLNTPATYAATEAFARTVAKLLHREHPKQIVADMSKELRRGRVFIDWSQNAPHKTTVVAYSLRAKNETPWVSTPVTWPELRRAAKRRDADALLFSPDAVLKRVKKLGDLFAPVLNVRQRLPEEFQAFGSPPSPPPARARRQLAGANSRRSRSAGAAALREYAAKRDFARTPEPAAARPRRSAQGSRRRFVIQQHAASHLHFDFRLEMADALKSWAVPKGLPRAKDEIRSAFATEDHPLDYLDFEGVIPEGQYGGGTVMVWDLGTYDVVDGNYWKGELRIFLNGRKLKGEWLLVRSRDERRDRNKWLITKTGAAAKKISARREERSVLSRRTMAEIAAAKDAIWQSNREPASNPVRASTRATKSRQPAKSRRRTGPMPDFVQPMTAREVAALPEGADWTYEIKWDGYRAIALKHGDRVRLLSRKEKDLESDFPGVIAAVADLAAVSATLDGEVVALDAEGRPSFTLLQNRAAVARDRIVFYAFDLLSLDGTDLRARPLAERKEKLAAIVAGTNVRLSPALDGTPEEIVRQVAQLGLEGVVAKRRDSHYVAGRESGAWVKLKLSPEQEFVIGGYKPGRPVESLVVGYYVGRKLMSAGKIRQGLNPRNRVELHHQLTPLKVEVCPFANLPDSKTSHFGEGITREQMAELRWVKPKLVAQVSFTEWTPGGHLRHGTFKALREDKNPRDVVRES